MTVVGEATVDEPFLIECNGIEDKGKETSKNSDKEGSCCRHRFNLCHKWSILCSWFVRLLQHLVGLLGEFVAKRPLTSITACIVFVSLCAVGFTWLKTESRAVKLFIPQDSRAIKDLNTAERFFRLKIRDEGIIVVSRPEHPNVLAPECLKEALEVHNQIITLKLYSEYCLTLSGEKAKSLDDC